VLSNDAFISFAQVLDPAGHKLYNEWHQLDHSPEKLVLPGTLWGERWVRTPECVDVSTASHPVLAGIHYLTTYWFADPPGPSIVEWQDEGERAFQWGGRPDVSSMARPLLGHFMVVKGYVAPRVLVSPEALPCRPNRGVIVSVRRMRDPHSEAAHDFYAWEDQVRIPKLLNAPGVAGAYTFSSRSTNLDEKQLGERWARSFSPSAASTGDIRVTLIFADEDPLDVFAAVQDRTDDGAPDAPDADAVSETLLESPLQYITPWKWDWFDGDISQVSNAS